MKNIITLDKNYNIRQRIKTIMANEVDVNVIEVSNSSQLFSEIKAIKIKPCLIILEIKLGKEDGFSIIKKLHDKNLDIPVIILTSENKRSYFIKAIQEGVVDYILKPFHEELLKERIVKHIEFNDENEDNINKEFSLNFQKYLQSEIKKSQKGKYSVSILMSTFFRPVEVFNENIHKEYLFNNNLIYEQLKDLFWETDILVKYGAQSFIGIFPFADENTTKVIIKKINNSFEEIKNKTKDLSKYSFINVYVTCPLEGTEREFLFENLSKKMENELNIKKQELVDLKVEHKTILEHN